MGCSHASNMSFVFHACILLYSLLSIYLSSGISHTSRGCGLLHCCQVYSYGCRWWIWWTCICYFWESSWKYVHLFHFPRWIGLYFDWEGKHHECCDFLFDYICLCCYSQKMGFCVILFILTNMGFCHEFFTLHMAFNLVKLEY